MFAGKRRGGAVRTSECVGHHQGVGSILWALPQTPRAGAWVLSVRSLFCSIKVIKNEHRSVKLRLPGAATMLPHV